MKRFALALALLLSFSLALADEPAKQPSPQPWIVFPEVSPSPAPPAPLPPPPSPDTIPRLSAAELYVVDAREPCFLVASPVGLVSVTQDAGPIKVRGRFLGGSGKYETKTFNGAAVFTVEAVARGRVELIVVKVGAKGPADIVRRTVDVDAGAGPQPPPTPPDPFDPLLTPIQAAYGADTSPTKVADKTSLAAVYRAVSLGVKDIATAGDLFGVIKGATENRIAARLKPLREVFGTELAKYLPKTPGAVLTVEQKNAAILQLNRYATILDGVK